MLLGTAVDLCSRQTAPNVAMALEGCSTVWQRAMSMPELMVQELQLSHSDST